MTPTTDRREIDELKASVDLVQLLQDHAIEVKKEGRHYKALCPFHTEETPSLSIDRKKGLYHCFGCGQSGDALSFLQQHGQRSFAQALQELRRRAGAPQAPSPAPAEAPFPYELMERVAEVWQRAFAENDEGPDYLESRGLRDRVLLRELRTGYSDGEKLLAITTTQERQALQRVGLVNERGKELLSRCVVFPLQDRHGRVVGFYGRSTVRGSKLPHRLCAGAGTGLFHRQAAHGAGRVFLVEGVLDALALHQAGCSSAMPLLGVQGSTAALIDHLRSQKVQQVVLCLDGDAAGEAARASLSQHFEKEGFAVDAVALPAGKDPLECSAQELQALLRPAENTPSGDERRWQKLSSTGGKLKVLVTVTHQGQKGEATVDLYSSRSRRQEALALSRRLGLEVADLEDWLFQVLKELEAGKGEEGKDLFARVEVAPMSAAQRQQALQFLKRPDLVEAILADMEAMGYMGEEEAKLLGYCVSVSRKLDKPMSAILQSGSGAGKSYLAETLQALTPPEDVVFYSRLSQQALYHMPKDYLRHKLLHLEERVGGEACDYQIRALQSAHRLVQAIVMKDPNTGQLFTKENEVLGPIAYLETTTSLRLNPENTSRCFEIPLDESPAQTRRIHQRQKALKGLARLSASDTRERLQERHHHAQRLLEEVPVVIPYVHLLTFPDQWLRARRDHDRFLHLIEVLAYLHQFQRVRKCHQGVEYLEATVSDYRWAYFLAHKVLGHSLDELSRWARELLTAFESEFGQPMTRRELREQLGWPDRRVREALEELVELEYLECLRGERNLFTFRLARASAGGGRSLGLLTPEELEQKWRES